MTVASSARAWALGIAAFTAPPALLLAYIWLSRSIPAVSRTWLQASWLMDLGALAFSALAGALLAWMATRGWARGALLGAYTAAVLGAAYANVFCRICLRLYGHCP